MKSASISEIKKELLGMPPKQLTEIVLRIAKYKKENKELLSYLLFEADDEEAFIQAIKDEMEQQFSEINKGHIYYAKKGLRKVLRFTNKFIKYSGIKETEVQLLMHYIHLLKKSGINYKRYTDLSNLYDRQIDKIQKAISKLHEDLQFDYQSEINKL